MEVKLLDRVREAIRVRHYSRRTEEAYTHWIRRYIVFHGKKPVVYDGNRRMVLGKIKHELVVSHAVIDG